MLISLHHANKALLCVQRKASSSKKAQTDDEESSLPETESPAEISGQVVIEQGLSRP